MGEVHDLLAGRGRQEARSMLEERRGPRIVEAAAAWAADVDISTGYIYSGWCQTPLPHRRPSDNSTIWKLESDNMTLLAKPGGFCQLWRIVPNIETSLRAPRSAWQIPIAPRLGCIDRTEGASPDRTHDRSAFLRWQAHPDNRGNRAMERQR